MAQIASMRIRRRLAASTALAVGLSCGGAMAQPGPVPLGAGEMVTGSLETEAARSYALEVAAGQFICGEANQLDVDVVVTVLDPSGKRIATFDGPGRGPEPFQFESDEAGTYRIEIAPFQGQRGDYTLVISRMEPIATDPGARVDQLMAAYDRPDVPGGVVAVIEAGEITFARAYGAANLTEPAPFEVDTRTNIGSTSKQFTAMAILLLAQRGKLSLDDDVRRHIPELPDFGETVTLRHLLTHTSGYREILNTLALAGWRLDEGDYIDRRQIIEVVQRQPALQNSPGAEWNYNNTGYGLLAQIVERISGESFPDWMRANIFAPLGMDDTSVRAHPGQIIAHSAQGYAPEGATGGFRNAPDLGGAPGPGAIYTTVGDLAKWVANYRTGELGGREALEQMMTPCTLTTGTPVNYGLGLFIDEYRGLKRIHHGGADTAHRSMLMYFPELDAAVITQSNNALFAPTIAGSVAEAFFGEHLEDEPETPELAAADAEATDFDPASYDPKAFDALAGRYELEELPGFVLTFTREEDKLFIQATGQPKVEIVPSGPMAFRLTVTDASMTFHAGDNGAVESLTLHQNGDHPAKRLKEAAWAPTAEELGAYTGRYYSEELETFYQIALEDGALALKHRRFDDIALTPGAKHVFSGGFPVAEVTFEADDSGAIVGLEVSNGRTRGVRFVRFP
ncbi:MAG: serine hydrolase [Phycisphaerales bacterium JB039]